MYRIREYTSDDLDQLVALFYGTVHTVNARDYSRAELEAWAPLSERWTKAGAWADSFSGRIALVAACGEAIVGFGDAAPDGYLDRLYIHKDRQGEGIGSALLAALEKEAREQGASSMRTEASITARPFFERQGFRVYTQQQVERHGMLLTNVIMRKPLL